MPDLSLQVKIMLYIAALACAVLSIVSITCGGIFPPAAEYAVYTAAGITLFVSCFYLAGDLDLLKQKIMELARSNTLTARLTDDIEYRSVLFAVCGVCMNIGVCPVQWHRRMDEPVRVVWYAVRVLSDPRNDARLLDISQSGQSEKPGKIKGAAVPRRGIYGAVTASCSSFWQSSSAGREAFM